MKWKHITCPQCSRDFKMAPSQMAGFSDVTHRGRCFGCGAMLEVGLDGNVNTAVERREEAQARRLMEDLEP
mgnify:CR=1 FL=1